MKAFLHNRIEACALLTTLNVNDGGLLLLFAPKENPILFYPRENCRNRKAETMGLKC
jgi:hypothetical protein